MHRNVVKLFSDIGSHITEGFDIKDEEIKSKNKQVGLT